jgi:hypothetical protein
MTQAERDKITATLRRFVEQDVPALSSCNMWPALTIRDVPHPLSALSAQACNDYAPAPFDTAADRDPAFDSVIAIWDGSGTDAESGQSLSIQTCAWTWGMGMGQTYSAIHVDFLSLYERNVLKHEWGHSIIFYYDAAGTAPAPAVNNHIDNSTHRYVNCVTGQPYTLQDESDMSPIPNSIYNDYSGFSHDYYSGQTATLEQPNRCLGITPAAWASGGPVSRPVTAAGSPRWRSPADDTVGQAVPFAPGH